MKRPLGTWSAAQPRFVGWVLESTAAELTAENLALAGLLHGAADCLSCWAVADAADFGEPARGLPASPLAHRGIHLRVFIRDILDPGRTLA